MCSELTKLVAFLEESVLACNRGPSPPLDEDSHKAVAEMSGISDGIGALEEALSRNECLRAVQLLHSMRWVFVCDGT